MNGKGPTKRKATAMNMLPTMETADGYLMRSQIWKIFLFLKKLYIFNILLILLIFWNKIMFSDLRSVKKTFLSLFVVLGHVQVGNFFLVFSLHTHHFQGDTIKSRQRFDHVVEERKEIQMNQSFPLNSLQSFSK